MNNLERSVQPGDSGERDMSEAYLRVTLGEDLEVVMGVNDRQLQATLRDDLKRLCAEWMSLLKAPKPATGAWETARIEFVTQTTIDREQQLRSTLEWILHQEDISDTVYARVRDVLGGDAGLPF